VDRQDDADHNRVVGWNLAAIMKQNLEAVGMLWMELTKERAHLSAVCTEDEVEQEVACCQEAMSSVLNATAKKITIYSKSKWWWNSDIIAGRKAVGMKKRRRRNSEMAPRV